MNIKFKSNTTTINSEYFNALELWAYVGRRGINYFTGSVKITLSDLEPLQLNFSPSEGL